MTRPKNIKIKTTYIHCSQSIAWLGNPRVTLQEEVEARPRKAVFSTRKGRYLAIFSSKKADPYRKKTTFSRVGYRRPPSRRASLKAQQSWQVPLKNNSSR
ncbi:3717_t:CDS:1 [Funneliformis geosporum]|uniref:3717_t:CDS:1 n=1 Tax=Funneliformis geosporum TaxID=1117311 RepID=A0A9W4WRM7_9GLOM|nr:3717_t:CDS:1 [Funneliformis geosporum]